MKRELVRCRKTDREIYYYDSVQRAGTMACARKLHALISEVLKTEKKRGVLILCIGTDRSTGDSLGPLIGHKLKNRPASRFLVIGTLERPVHAVNLEQARDMIRVCYPDYVIVAIDASVGRQSHVGCVTVGKGALRPGLGVCKNLNAVGDVFITGIVGGYGSRDPLMLQSVRLSIVMKMADYICESVSLVEQFWENRTLV